MKKAKEKLRQIKKKHACWDKNAEHSKCSATPCSSSTPSTGDGCHGDGSDCGGDNVSGSFRPLTI